MKSAMTSPSTSSSKAAEAYRRARRLQRAVLWAGRWFMAQGLLYCAAGERLSQLLGLRWQDLMTPYLRLAGASLLTLGLLVNAGLRAARYQYMAVDGLILCLLAQAYFNLSYCLGGHSLAHFEWLALAVNLGLGGALTAFRTRSSEMDPDSAGALLALPVTQLARQVRQGQWREAWLELRRPRKVDLGPEPEPPKPEAKRSEALPRLD
jgi:hypothetical protein